MGIKTTILQDRWIVVLTAVSHGGTWTEQSSEDYLVAVGHVEAKWRAMGPIQVDELCRNGTGLAHMHIKGVPDRVPTYVA